MGDLSPSSSETFLRLVSDEAFKIIFTTRVEPVKDIYPILG